MTQVNSLHLEPTNSPNSVVKDESGAALVEAAVGFLPFLLLLFGLLQMLSFAHTTMSMHYALSKSARWGVLNQTRNDVFGNPMSRVDSIKDKFREVAPRYGVNPDAITLRVCPATAPDCTVESAGAQGRPYIIHAERQSTFVWGFGFLNPRTSVLITNEPQLG